MEFKKIQDLVKLFSKSDLSKLKIEDGDFKITLKSNVPENNIISAAQPTTILTQAPPVVTEQQTGVKTTEEKSLEAETNSDDSQSKIEDENYITVNSPMIGTFYRSSSPDKPPFVKVGDSVDEGSVLCIIEAMKLFNEIESEVSGKIVKVLIEDATPVEYDQPLFLIDPS